MTTSFLPYPVTFVVKNTKKWSELFKFSESSIPDPSSLHTRIQNSEDCWVVLTYLYLRRKKLNVSISDKFISGEICVANGRDFGIRDLTFNSFVVGCQADDFKSALFDFTIVQNKANIDSATDIFIYHWPQPALVPRLKERGNTIENLVFMGDERNLYESFRSVEFQRELEKIGIKLKIYGKPKTGSVMWHDYSTADLVLAVRDLTEKDALIKPASKLINAWTAGVPALLGPEPAFRDLRQSELDYIEIKTPQAVLEIIQQLKSQPELYQQMIANGLQRAKDFTVENIIEQWYQALSVPIAAQYERWRRRTKISRATAFAFKSIQHKIAHKKATYNRFHGYRIISGKYT